MMEGPLKSTEQPFEAVLHSPEPTPRHSQSEPNTVFEVLVGASSPDRHFDLSILEGVDWGDLLTAARHHSLLPVLAHRVLEDEAATLPAGIRSQLRDQFHANLIRNLHLLQETARVLAALNNSGIDAVPYKGPIMADQLWGSFALRESTDVDVLVRESDAIRASELLLDLGYERVSPVADWLRTAVLKNASEEQFRHTQRKILLELQWSPAPGVFGAKFDETICWNALETIDIDGHGIRVPCTTALVGLLAIHGWKHNWSKLIWVADMARLLRRPDVDWRLLIQSAQRDAWKRILILGLEMASSIYGVPVPPLLVDEIDPALRALARDLRSNLQTTTTPGYTDWHRYMLRARDSFTHQIRQLRRFALTPGIAEYERLRLSRTASIGYRALRLARVLKLWPGKV
jgi:Uncharacterised nucleotidyltransferase